MLGKVCQILKDVLDVFLGLPMQVVHFIQIELKILALKVAQVEILISMHLVHHQLTKMEHE